MNLAGKQSKSWLFASVAAVLLVAALPTAAELDRPRPPGANTPLHAIARTSNEELLDAIRIDRPKPPVHARNLWHLSIAMWGAWADFDTQANRYVYTDKHAVTDLHAARREAISYAAYRLLVHRFPGGGYEIDGVLCQPGAEVSLVRFEQLMLDLGFDPDDSSTEGDSPAAIGNRIGQAVIAKALEYYATPYDPAAVPGPFSGCDDDEVTDDGYDSFDREWGRRGGTVRFARDQ